MRYGIAPNIRACSDQTTLDSYDQSFSSIRQSWRYTTTASSILFPLYDGNSMPRLFSTIMQIYQFEVAKEKLAARLP